MTLTEFKAHILVRLGSPVINIELDETQMAIYIADAVEKFIEVHYDGLDEGYIFVDITAGTGTYTLPSTVHSVLEILNVTSTLISDEPLLINPYLAGNTYATDGMGSPSILDVYMFRQSFSQFSSALSATLRFEYNDTTNLLSILEIPDEDGRYALRVHSSPSSTEAIYGNSWVQKYATALCKIAWANNIGKFEGATLPGGVSLNYQKLTEEGETDKEKLEEELYERYQEPIDFFTA